MFLRKWRLRAALIDNHVESDKNYYSAPHTLLREKVWVPITARTVEIFHRGERVTAHLRTSSNRQHSTVRDHMPSSHRRLAHWTPEKLRRKAAGIGPETLALVEVILRERTHEQGFRSCLGIMRLARCHGRDRLEAACKRALEIGARSYTSVNSILRNNLDRKRSDPAVDGQAISHSNILRAERAPPVRRVGYFH